MAATTYAEFRRELFDRHQNSATSALSTLGDLLPAVGVVAAVVTHDRRWLAAGGVAGLAVASVAHLFQPGTIGAEYKAFLQHPSWAARAERDRVLGRTA